MSANKKRIEVYVTEQEHYEVKNLCAQLKISMSWFVDMAIRDRIKKVTQSNKQKRTT